MVRSLVPRSENGGELHPESRSPFNALQREMNRMFDRFFGETGMAPFAGTEGLAATPRIDVSESEEAVEIAAELPGMSEQDVDVSLTHDVLTIRGEKKQEHEDKQKNYHRIERSYGAFHRAIMLPAEVDAEKVDARFTNGVLRITLPKLQKGSGSKKIEIRRSE